MPRRFATPVKARIKVPAKASLKAVASLVFVLLIAAACSSDGFPESYTAQIDEETGLSNVEQNWLDGCTVGLAQSDLAADANRICRCSFDEISGSNGIPFEDFVELNNELKGDPEGLAESDSDGTLTATERRLLEIVRDCIARS